SNFPTLISGKCDYTPVDLQNITVTAQDDDAGTHQVNLNFWDNIMDNVAPKVSAGADKYPDEDETVRFYGSGSDTVSDRVVSYEWDLGDCTTWEGAEAVNVYEQEGTYFAVLRAWDTHNGMGIDVAVVEVSNPAPSAVVREIPPAIEDEIFTLNGTESTDNPSDFPALRYLWTVEGYPVAAEAVGLISLPNQGIYTASLTVWDDNGLYSTATRDVKIENLPPLGYWTAPANVSEGTAARIILSPMDTPNDLGLIWAEIAGINGTSAVFTYNTSGNKTIPLEVMDEDGAVWEEEIVLEVLNLAPILAIPSSFKFFAGVENYTYEACLWDTPNDYPALNVTWDFGDGCVLYGWNVTHAYTKDGNYTLNVTVRDDDGAEDNCSALVQVRIDTDGDGLPDWWEITYGLDYLDPTGDNGTAGDPDKDFLINLVEYYGDTHPKDDDTDNDGIIDGNEDANWDAVRQLDEADPHDHDTDDDGLNDGLEIGLSAPQGKDTKDWQPDMDNTTVTDPLDKDSDDDGIMDGNEDLNKNGRMDAKETDASKWDSDTDYLSDALEQGFLAPQTTDTDVNKFMADTDPTTTTIPWNPDSDGDGLLDGQEDFTHDGAVDVTEPDPNDPDSDDDGVYDGHGNMVNVLILKTIENTGGPREIYLWMNGSALPHIGYRVPAEGAWSIVEGDESSPGITVINQTVAVAFFLNEMPITVRDDGAVVNYIWVPDGVGSIPVTAGDLTLWFERVKMNNTFPDPNPIANDTDDDGMNDFVEAMYLSGRVRDFRIENTDDDDINRTLLDNTTVWNNLVDPDSDNDTVPDGYEWTHNSNMLVVDTEGDGLNDYQELLIYKTNPCDPDTDWDGLSDYGEVFIHSTHPKLADTDDDDLYDGWVDANHNQTYEAGEAWGEMGDPANASAGGYGTQPTLDDTD
ncbi:MAG: PKD domain-containing protein, partial [Candidatus Thermoplasmatota archaeon]